MEHPSFAQIHQCFSPIVNAMNNYRIQESGGRIRWEMVMSSPGAGPVDIARLMRECRQDLDNIPNHGVDLAAFDEMIERWNRIAQTDQSADKLEDDWRWVMNHGRGPETNP
jgi:hypothetical protein